MKQELLVKYACCNYHKIWVEARGRELHGTVLALLLKYTDGLDSIDKGNIDKHGKSGEQHGSSIWNFTALLPSHPFMLVHNSASPEFFFYITCFNTF